jgi:cytochrome c-type biogenesis protein CcmH
LQSPLLLLTLLLALAVAVALYVILPLLRQRPSGAARPADDAAAADPARDDDAARVAATTMAVLRERRRELEASLAHLPMDAPERRAALDEFTVQAAAELGGTADSASSPSPSPGQAPAPASSSRRRALAATALATALVVPAFVFYLLSGAPEVVSPEAQASQSLSLDEMAERLRGRLAQEPDRADGWQLLGRTELARGRFPEAIDALERAAKLEPADPGVKVDLADALAQNQGARLDGRPIELIREALAIDPQHQKGLALAGAWSVGQRDFPAAIRHWELLFAQLPPGSPQAEQVAGLLADLRAGRQPGLAADGPRDAPQAGAPAAPGAAGPSSASAPVATSAPVLRGKVELAAPLAGRAQPGDTLFVVARALDAQGRPAGPPVALLSARVGDLPLEFALDDSMAMVPSARLSSSERVTVVARVSRTGEATVRPGDLQGASQPVAPDARGVRVLIDTVVP